MFVSEKNGNIKDLNALRILQNTSSSDRKATVQQQTEFIAMI